MADLKTREDIIEWLVDEPQEVVIVFAARAALRAVPFLSSATVKKGDFAAASSVIILRTFYSLRTTLCKGIHPEMNINFTSAAEAADEAAEIVDGITVHHSYTHAAVYMAYFAAQSTLKDDAILYSDAAADIVNTTAADNPTFWKTYNYDRDFLRQQRSLPAQTALALSSQPLWPNEPTGIPLLLTARWDELRQKLIKLDEDWNIWVEWYQDRLNGASPATAIDLEIAKINSLEKNYNRGAKVANAELKRLSDEFYAKLRASTQDDEALTTQVPGIYAFGARNGKLHANALASRAVPLDLAIQEKDVLLKLCRMAKDTLVNNNADAPIVDLVTAMTDILGRDFSKFPAGSLKAYARALSAFADIYNLSERETDRTIGGLLEGIKRSANELLGYFPELAKPEAQRLALEMQSKNAVAVERRNVAMSNIAQSSELFDVSAVDALTDSQSEVAEIFDRLERASLSTKDRAALNEKIGELVSTRLLTVRNMTAAILKNAEKEKTSASKPSMAEKAAKAAKDGVIDGIKTTTKTITVGGFAALASVIAPELAGYAKVVARMLPFARRTQDFNDDADDIDIDIDV